MGAGGMGDNVAQKMTWMTAMKVIVVSGGMGLAFGTAMESGKVTLPIVIRQQFLFQRFIMLKMFLSAAGMSAFVLALLDILAPKKLAAARAEFMKCVDKKNLLGVAGGASLLGMGMALGGACPGMVLVQVGSGVQNSLWTLFGGVLASLVYGTVLQPIFAPSTDTCKGKRPGVEDLAMFKGVPFHTLAFGLAGILGAIIFAVETYAPWDSASEVPKGLTAWTQIWPAVASGVMIGFNQVPAVLFLGDTLGSSSAYMTLNAQILTFSKGLQKRFKHLEGYRCGPGNMWQLVYICAAVLGAYISSTASGSYGYAKGVSIPESVLGGAMMLLGSRIASGCTSGHGLSGMGLLCVDSIVAVCAMFGAGIATALIMNSVDPTYISKVMP